MEFIVSLSRAGELEERSVGQRAKDLAKLKEKGFDILPCFVVTNEAFEHFIAKNLLQGRVAMVLASVDPPEEKYRKIREAFLRSTITDDMMRELTDAYEGLGLDADASADALITTAKAAHVNLVLSPAYTAPADSTEGFLLNVKGLEGLAVALKECWACLFTTDAQGHRERVGVPNKSINAGVIIQQMAKPVVSAEAWSAAPGATDDLIVRAYFGALDVTGVVEKDEWRLNREYLKPSSQSIAVQTRMLARDEEDRLEEAPIGERGREQKANDKEMLELARLAKKAAIILERHVKLYASVVDERVVTVCASRLHVTPGSFKLDQYREEERIEEDGNDHDEQGLSPEAEPRPSFSAPPREESDDDFILPREPTESGEEPKKLKTAAEEPDSIFTSSPETDDES